jgi:hypothetical protein
MALSAWINLVGLGVLITGILLMIWSLSRSGISSVGLALMISGFLLQLAAAFFK